MPYNRGYINLIEDDELSYLEVEKEKLDKTKLKHYCILEDMLCKYANNIRGLYAGSFTCEAPADYSILCKKY